LIIFLILFSNISFSDYRLGDGKSMLYGEWKVIKDVQVNNLRIKLVRSISGQETTSYGTKQKITCRSGNYEIIDFYGIINEDTTFILEELLKEINICKGNYIQRPVVYMSSGGGIYSDGFEVAKVLRKYDVIAAIPWAQKCSSSCATAFMGAKHRAIRPRGEIVLHAPYMRDKKGITCKTDENLKEFYQEMIGSNSLGERLYKKTMQFCGPNSGWSANHDAAELYGIVNYKFNSDKVDFN